MQNSQIVCQSNPSSKTSKTPLKVFDLTIIYCSIGKTKSYHQFLQQFNLESRNIVLKIHGIGICQAKHGEDDEEGLTVLSLACLAESNLFLVSRYLECITIVLMGIPAISRDKSVESIDELTLTTRINKIKLLEVMDEGIGSNELEGCNLTTVVLNTTRIEFFMSSMCDHFGPAS